MTSSCKCPIVRTFLVNVVFTCSFSETPTLATGPKNITSQVNRTVLFDCKATSNLASKISWFKRGKGDSKMISVDTLGQRFIVFSNGSLQVQKVQKQDEGFYQCRAENPVGYITTKAFLRVLGKA